MKPFNFKNSLPTLLGGLCFAVIALLVLIAYFPGFAPVSYENLRRTKLIMIVPMLAASGLLSSVGWLWFESKEKISKGENDEL